MRRAWAKACFGRQVSSHLIPFTFAHRNWPEVAIRGAACRQWIFRTARLAPSAASSPPSPAPVLFRLPPHRRRRWTATSLGEQLHENGSLQSRCNLLCGGFGRLLRFVRKRHERLALLRSALNPCPTPLGMLTSMTSLTFHMLLLHL